MATRRGKSMRILGCGSIIGCSLFPGGFRSKTIIPDSAPAGFQGLSPRTSDSGLPHPPKDTDGRREGSGRGVGDGATGEMAWGLGVDGRPAAGPQSPHRAPKVSMPRWREDPAAGDSRAGARLRGRWALHGWPSGRERNGLQPGQGGLNWIPRPAPGEMQAARRAGDPSHQSEDPPPEGLVITVRSPRPNGPGYAPSPGPPASGGEARRRHVVSPTPYLRAYGVLDLGVAAMIGLQFPSPHRGQA